MPALSSLFRNSAAKAVEYRWFSPVLIVTPPSARPTMGFALLAICCLLTAGVVIEIPERVRASGVLLPSEGFLRIRARRSGWVDRLNVSNGATVQQGDVLMWLTDTQRAPERQPESAERLASLRKELGLFEQSVEQEIAAVDIRQRHNRSRMALIEQRLMAARAEHETRQQQAELLDSRAIRVATLAANGLLSVQNADELAAAGMQAQAAAQMVWQRVLALREDLLALEQQIVQDDGSPDLLRTKAGIRRESILRDIAETELRSAVEVTAPGNGIVAGLVVRSGSFVQAGQVIMTVHDPADRLEARLYVGADNATMISPGQRVELQLQAYPHQLFGTQSAVITSVSAVALLPREFESSIPMQGPVFEIRATLKSTEIEARGSVWQLPPGTVFTADLVRRRWPLYRWLLRSGEGKDSRHA